MKNEQSTSLSIDTPNKDQLIKYTSILQNHDRLTVRINNKIIYCKPNSLELIWRLIDLIPEENILFSYYIDQEKHRVNQNDTKLKAIINLKEKANKIVGNLPEEAISIYNEALTKIDEIERNDNSNLTKQLNEEIKTQKKLIISNKAYVYTKLKRYNDAIEFDLMIISSLDHLFDKSYARIISNYIEQQEIIPAAHYLQEMKMKFSVDICDKYKSIFERLEQEEAESNRRLKTITRNSQKNQKNLKEKIHNELQLKQKQRRYEKKSSLWFNITTLVVSGLALCILYNYKSYYI